MRHRAGTLPARRGQPGHIVPSRCCGTSYLIKPRPRLSRAALDNPMSDASPAPDTSVLDWG